MLSLLLISRALSAAPARILVPRAKMQITHSRSSGPGGQNVNKVNTKVELRFNVREAEWLVDEVRARLEEAQKNRINKEGELIVSASESRSQASNFQSALDKIQAMVDDACIPPKVPWLARFWRPPGGCRARVRCSQHTLARNTIRSVRASDAPLTAPQLPRPSLIGSQERHAWVGLSDTTKRMRVEDKRRTSQVKHNRARVDY